MRIFYIFLSLYLSVMTASVCAQGLATERNDLKFNQDDYHDVASELRCPTCTGLSVLDSDAAFSIQIKNEVKEQLAAGKNKDVILKFFTERYGPWILRSPPTQGIHAWAWFVPVAALILGPIVLWFFVWRRKYDVDSGEIVSRPMEQIIREMNERLNGLRNNTGGHK